MKKPASRSPRKTTRLAFEALEPRALLSADLLPAVELPEPLPPAPAEFRVAEATAPTVSLGTPRARELVILDAAVESADALAATWAARGVEVVRLDPALDALTQIGALLAGRAGLDAVHLVSHGTAGAMMLGGVHVDAAALSARSTDIAKWADAFAPDADLMLYACDLAAGDAGSALLERLALLTGADVAASDDATGARALGGDWELERTHGVIETAALDAADWHGLLAQAIDWSMVTWTAGDVGPITIAIGALGNVTATITGDTGRLDPSSPGITTNLEGGFGGAAGSSLSLESVGGSPAGFAATESVDFVLDFTALPGEVVNLAFYVFDIDVSGGGTGFIDRVTVTANNGALDPTTLTATGIANDTLGANTILGIGNTNAPSPSGDGNGYFVFAQRGIASVELNYGNANAADQSRQGIGVNTVTFDIAPRNLHPTGVTATESTPFAFTGGNALSVSDDDASQVTLTVGNGTLALTAQGGAVLGGSGGNRTVNGSLADINATLATLVYTPTPGFNGADTLTFVSSDGTYTDSDTVAITVDAVNDAPVLGALAGDARSYAAGAGAVTIDQGAAATVTDPDSTDFDGGTLTVAIVAGGDPSEDVLVLDTGTVMLSAGMSVGSVVSVGGVAIGTLTSDGSGASDLAVSLNAQATPARVETLVRAVGYQNNDAVAPTPGSRTVRFTLSDGDGGTSAAADATVTVKPVVAVAATDASAAEPGDNGRFSVTLSAASATDTVVAYTLGGTALNGSDYALLTGSVTILAGDTTAFIDVLVLDDAIVEAAETVVVTLTSIAAGDPDIALDAGALAATVTLADDDVATLTIADAAASEDGGVMLFTVSVDRAVQGGFTIDALLASGSAFAGVDFDGATQTLTFAGLAGETRVLAVPLLDDAVVEPAETFTVSLGNLVPASAPPASFDFSDTATGTIADDDRAPSLADAIIALAENSPAATLLVDLADAITGTDADADGDAITYAILAGNGAGAFAIDPLTGRITVADALPLDFETTPTFVLTVEATDGTNSGTATLTVDLVNVNEAPSLALPLAASVTEDTLLTFSPGLGRAIVAGDVDAATLRVTLAATQGTLTLGTLAGLAFTAGDGVADAAMTFTGSIAAINAALDGLGFLGAADYHGAATVSVLLEDFGQSGTGGPQSAGATVAVTVTPVNDPPALAGDLALLVLEGQAVTVLSADLLGVDVDDAGAGLMFNVLAAPGRGRMEFADAPGAAITRFTQADLDAGRVRYVHDGSETTADAFTLRLSDGGEDGAAPALGTLDIVVVPVNDAPAIATGGTDLDPRTRIVLTSSLVSATDPDNALEGLLFTLDTILGGFVELAIAAGVPITAFTGAQLDAGLVRFVHTDAAATPAFRVSVSDGLATDGPRAVVLTLRAVGGVQPSWSAVDAGPGGLVALPAFRSETRGADVRAPEPMAFLREPVIATSGPTLAEPQPAAPIATRERVAGALVESPRIEVAAAGLRFEPPASGEVIVPRIDFSFDTSRHDLEPAARESLLAMAAQDGVRFAGIALTAGGVWWVFRMGSLLGSALVSAPAWRHIDPLPVLGGGRRERVEWESPATDRDDEAPETGNDREAGEQYFSTDPTQSPDELSPALTQYRQAGAM